MSNLPDLLRAAVFLRDGGACVYCGAAIEEVDLEVDHLVARARGGQDVHSNLVTSCHECNHDKGVVHVEAYILDRRLSGKPHEGILERVRQAQAKPLDMVGALDMLDYLEHLRNTRR
jgi:hypothetical protein